MAEKSELIYAKVFFYKKLINIKLYKIKLLAFE